MPFSFWLNLDEGMAVLAAAAGLADEFALPFGRLGDGLAVGDLGRAGVGFDLEFALEAVNDDFEVQFTHARNDEPGWFPGW